MHMSEAPTGVFMSTVYLACSYFTVRIKQHRVGRVNTSLHKEKGSLQLRIRFAAIAYPIAPQIPVRLTGSSVTAGDCV